MPTPDDRPAPRRAARRPLGRGPGTGPPAPAEVPETEPGAVGPVEPVEPEHVEAAEPVESVVSAGPDEGVGESELAPAVPAEVPAAGDSEVPEDSGPESGAEPAHEEPERAGEPTDSAEPGAMGEGSQSGGDGGGDGRFTVRLDNFEGPFDLLLQLISKHKLDVTEVALSRVTDEFMAHIHAMGPDWDLDQATEFLVVAATLLDLKAARLLPAAEIEDEADLALLEARDLLFARLLQYRAYKEVADIFAGRLADEARRHPRTVGLEPHHAELLPEVAISIGGEGFAKLAVKAMQPKPKPQVYVEHIHAPLVSVREQAEVVVARLRELGRVSFRQLTEDAPDTLTVVARFLALLELYRERAVDLDQEEALGDITVRWSGALEADAESLVTDEFDRQPQAPDSRTSDSQAPDSQAPDAQTHEPRATPGQQPPSGQLPEQRPEFRPGHPEQQEEVRR